jgi:hypothetical protein
LLHFGLADALQVTWTAIIVAFLFFRPYRSQNTLADGNIYLVRSCLAILPCISTFCFGVRMRLWAED